jgi:hypothetical protein
MLSVKEWVFKKDIVFKSIITFASGRVSQRPSIFKSEGSPVFAGPM